MIVFVSKQSLSRETQCIIDNILCMYVYVHAYMHTQTHVHARTHIFYTHTHTQSNWFIIMHKCAQWFVCVWVHTTYIHIHNYINSIVHLKLYVIACLSHANSSFA